MKSLKELMDEQDASDIKLIKMYLSQPEIITEAPELLTSIMQAQLNKYIELRRQQLSWGTMSFDYYYDIYPKPIASMLTHLTLKVIAQDEFSDVDINWLNDVVPTLKLGYAFFNPLLQKINFMGLRFKEQTQDSYFQNVREYVRNHPDI